MSSVSLRLATGEALLGTVTVPVALVGDRGELRVGGPAGPVVRPIRFGERGRAVRHALAAAEPLTELAGTVGVLASGSLAGADLVVEVLALHLAGAGSGGPGFATVTALLSRSLGWGPEALAASDAAEADDLARLLSDAAAGDEWQRVVFDPVDASESGDDLVALRDALAADLLRRGQEPPDLTLVDRVDTVGGPVDHGYHPPAAGADVEALGWPARPSGDAGSGPEGGVTSMSVDGDDRDRRGSPADGGEHLSGTDGPGDLTSPGGPDRPQAVDAADGWSAAHSGDPGGPARSRGSRDPGSGGSRGPGIGGSAGPNGPGVRGGVGEPGSGTWGGSGTGDADEVFLDGRDTGGTGADPGRTGRATGNGHGRRPQAPVDGSGVGSGEGATLVATGGGVWDGPSTGPRAARRAGEARPASGAPDLGRLLVADDAESDWARPWPDRPPASGAGAGWASTPEQLADAIAAELHRTADLRGVDR